MRSHYKNSWFTSFPQIVRQIMQKRSASFVFEAYQLCNFRYSYSQCEGRTLATATKFRVWAQKQNSFNEHCDEFSPGRKHDLANSWIPYVNLEYNGVSDWLGEIIDISMFETLLGICSSNCSVYSRKSEHSPVMGSIERN